MLPERSEKRIPTRSDPNVVTLTIENTKETIYATTYTVHHRSLSYPEPIGVTVLATYNKELDTPSPLPEDEVVNKAVEFGRRSSVVYGNPSQPQYSERVANLTRRRVFDARDNNSLESLEKAEDHLSGLGVGEVEIRFLRSLEFPFSIQPVLIGERSSVVVVERGTGGINYYDKLGIRAYWLESNIPKN